MTETVNPYLTLLATASLACLAPQYTLALREER